VKRHIADAGIPTLRVALNEYMTSEELKKLAALTKEKPPTRKAELADLIVRHLAGAGLRRVWQSLDDLERAAVAEVVHSSTTRFHAERFIAKYGRDPVRGTEDRTAYHRSPSRLDFLFYGIGTMPDDLKARLAGFVPPPIETTVQVFADLPETHGVSFSRWNRITRSIDEGTEGVPLAIHQTESIAQRELLSILRLIDAGKVSVSDKTRRPASTTIAMITNVLERGDYYPRLPVKDKWHDENAGPIRAFAWPLLLQAGGLAQLSGSKLRLTKAGRRALGEAAAETIRVLWKKWVDTPVLDELSRIDCVKGQSGKGRRGLTAVSARRGAIAGGLARCPDGAWILTDEFCRFLRASGCVFSVTRSAWDLYLSEPQYGSLGVDNGARLLDERYLYCLLLEYAATLGMIDVALIPPSGARHDYGNLWGTDDLVYFSRYDGLIYLRVTPLGAYCLDVSSKYQPAPVVLRPALRVLPTLEVVAVGAKLEPGDRLLLDAYAIRVSDFEWRLDAEMLLDATESGRSVGEIREFLTFRSGDAIPGTVIRLFEEVAGRASKIRDRGLVRLIECSDPTLAALVASDSRTRKYCMRAGDRHLVVPKRSEAGFRRALRELGYLLATGGARSARGKRRIARDDTSAPTADI